jgi:hypothetical protein
MSFVQPARRGERQRMGGDDLALEQMSTDVVRH